MEFRTIALIQQTSERIAGYFPRLGIGLLVLIIGILVGKGLFKLTQKGLEKAGMDRAYKKTGIEKLAHKVRIYAPASHVFAGLLKYVIYILALVIAFDIFGFYIIGEVVQMVVSYIPKTISAVTILIFGFIIAGFVADLIGRSMRGAGVDKVAQEVGVKFEVADLAESVTRYFLYIFVVLISLTSLQISIDILIGLFNVFFAGVMLALALVFVLALRDVGPNLAAGLYFQSNRVFRRDQKLTFRKITGTIESVDFLYVTVLTDKGKVRIPNRLLMKEEFLEK